MKKNKNNKSRKNDCLLMISVVFAVVFMVSPALLRFDWFNSIISGFLEPLKCSEYKGAFVGATGGMIGAFLAITGALWVERKIASDNDRKEIEKTALIVYYDMVLFYEDVSHLAMQIARIIGIPNEDEKIEEFIKNKKWIMIHIHSEWISLVATLKEKLDEEELKKIYTFYGEVSNMKAIIEDQGERGNNIGKVNKIINDLGDKKENEYKANELYQETINKIKKIARI